MKLGKAVTSNPRVLGLWPSLEAVEQRLPALELSCPARGQGNHTQPHALLEHLPSRSPSRNIPKAIAHMEKKHKEII